MTGVKFLPVFIGAAAALLTQSCVIPADRRVESASLFRASLDESNVVLPKFFSSNMVLQRGVPVPVFGKADPGKTVMVSFAGQEHEAVAGPDGRWETVLDPLKASRVPRALVAGSAVCTNVLVGDVWMLAGAGRMGGQFRRSKEPEAADLAKRASEQRFVRIAHVPHATADYPGSDRAYAEGFLDKRNRWMWNGDNVAYHPVFVFAFGERMFRKTGVPVGVIYMPGDGWEWADVSGFTSAEAFRETEGLEDFSRKVDAFLPETEIGAKALDEYIGRFEAWRGGTVADLDACGGSAAGEAPVLKHLSSGDFCGEFNAMAWPMRRVKARRFIMFVTNPPEGKRREDSRYDLRVEAMRRCISEAFDGMDVAVETMDAKRGLVGQGRDFAEKAAKSED